MSEVLNFDALAMEGQLSTEVFLKLQPPHFSRTYGILISFATEDKETASVKYEMMVTYVKTLVTEQIRVFKLERLGRVYINDIEPESTADQLAYETGKVFYPLFIQVGFDGAFTGVFNHEEIRKRWVDVKNDVRAYFTGEETEKYLAQTEQIINDDFALDICFEQDWFIAAFFAPIYKSYGGNREVKTLRHFQISPNSAPENFQVTETISSFLNHYGAIEIHHEAEPAENFNEPEDGEKEQYNRFESSYRADIVLEKDTKSIDSIVASWGWKDDRQKSVELSAFSRDEPIEVIEERNQPAQGLVFLDKAESDNTGGLGYFFKSIFKKG